MRQKEVSEGRKGEGKMGIRSENFSSQINQKKFHIIQLIRDIKCDIGYSFDMNENMYFLFKGKIRSLKHPI